MLSKKFNNVKFVLDYLLICKTLLKYRKTDNKNLGKDGTPPLHCKIFFLFDLIIDTIFSTKALQKLFDTYLFHKIKLPKDTNSP